MSVTLGKTHTGIDFAPPATIVQVGSIAGTISERAGGTPLQSAVVEVFAGDTKVGDATTDAAGRYKVGNLQANATGYVVCAKAVASTSSATVSTPATGWAPRCYPGVSWNGSNSPAAAATRLPLLAGQDRTGINITLRVGARISGTAFRGSTSTRLASVRVLVFTLAHRGVATVTTSLDGTYRVPRLAPASYIVCFDGRSATLTGYRPQCYDQVPWDGTT
ncbi:MAG: hypothetical protein ABR571_01325 [Jatrophihabitans sp.]|uniref:hypothetical protein n=1 Tax=Jatrophihabitans sp. TaxID=1932789 RepID=UPI00390D03DA